MFRIRMRYFLYAFFLFLAYRACGSPLSGLLGGPSSGKQAVLDAQNSPLRASGTSQTYDVSKPWRHRIVALGDLHGDLNHATRILRKAGLIDLRGEWIGKTATLIQTGDIVDRGTDTIALYHLFDRLRAQARLAGGKVVSLLGNHEFMNAMGDWRYVTREDIGTFQGADNRRKVMSDAGWIGQTWLANYSVAAREAYAPSEDLPGFGEAAVIAVHGGIHPLWADLERVNTVGHSLLSRSVSGGVARSYSLPSGTTEEERDFYSEHGPVWYRGYATDSEDDGICELAEQTLKKTGARRMIMGHTPHFESIRSRCRGKILIIDTGISSAYGGVLSALEIEYTLTPSGVEEGSGWWPTSTKKPTKLIEKEVVTALYLDERDVIVNKERTIDLTSP